MSGPSFSRVFRPTFPACFCILLMICADVLAQNAQPQSGEQPTVQLQIELQLPDATPNAAPRQTTLMLQPLEHQATPKSVTVSESAPTVLTLPAGRYEITSTEPVDVDGQPYGWDVE